MLMTVSPACLALTVCSLLAAPAYGYTSLELHECRACEGDGELEPFTVESCDACTKCAKCNPYSYKRPAIFHLTGRAVPIGNPSCSAIVGCKRRGDRVRTSGTKLRDNGGSDSNNTSYDELQTREYTHLGGCCRTLAGGFGTFTEHEVDSAAACAFLCDNSDTCLAYELEPVIWKQQTVFYKCELHTAAIVDTSNGFHCGNGKKSCYQAQCDGSPDPAECSVEVDCNNATTATMCPIRCSTCEVSVERALLIDLAGAAMTENTRLARRDTTAYLTIEVALTDIVTKYVDFTLEEGGSIIVSVTLFAGNTYKVLLHSSVPEAALTEAEIEIAEDITEGDISFLDSSTNMLYNIAAVTYTEESFTNAPTTAPTEMPTLSPTEMPTLSPTGEPTVEPTAPEPEPEPEPLTNESNTEPEPEPPTNEPTTEPEPEPPTNEPTTEPEPEPPTNEPTTL